VAHTVLKKKRRQKKTPPGPGGFREIRSRDVWVRSDLSTAGGA